jgi:hypothetical protein
MQSWEYLITWLDHEEEKERLSELEAKGWELVTVIVDEPLLAKAYFKRPAGTYSKELKPKDD